jgi:hypothetical protein
MNTKDFIDNFDPFTRNETSEPNTPPRPDWSLVTIGVVLTIIAIILTRARRS